MLEEGLGLTPTTITPEKVRYSLEDGTRLEAYSEINEFHAFFTTGPVVGLQVDDFDRSWTNLQRLGIVGLADVQSADGGTWVHFRLPDGTIVELTSAPHSAGRQRGRE